MVTVVENIRQGSDNREDANQMSKIKTLATVLDMRGSNGRTMAMYLSAYKYTIFLDFISYFQNETNKIKETKFL